MVFVQLIAVADCGCGSRFFSFRLFSQKFAPTAVVMGASPEGMPAVTAPLL
jgi:hypothetical protein